MADYEFVGEWRKKNNGCSDTLMGILFFIFVIVPIVGIVTMCGGGDSSSSSVPNNTAQVNNGGYVGGNVDSTEVIAETAPSVVGLESLKKFDSKGYAAMVSTYYDIYDSYGNKYRARYLSLSSSNHEHTDTKYNNSNGYTSWIEFATGEKYNYFSATVFCEDGMDNDQTIEFFIYADGVLVYSSGIMNNKTKAFDINVCINNCDVLRIESSCPDKIDFALSTPAEIIMINPKVSN